jgi:hypothetical protein
METAVRAAHQLSSVLQTAAGTLVQPDVEAGRYRTDLELLRRKISDVGQTAADPRRLQMGWKEQ